MAQRQRSEIVAANAFLAGFEHVRLQQRVVRDAGQRDAVVGEDVLVVFEVLADLGVLRRFEPRLQTCEYIGRVQLGGRARIVVRQRQVSRFSRGDGERDADQPRGEGVEAGRFGVERGERRGFDLRQPDGESRCVDDRRVIGAMRAVVGEQVGGRCWSGRCVGRGGLQREDLGSRRGRGWRADFLEPRASSRSA